MRSVNRAYMISIGFSVQPQKIPRIHSDYIPSKYSVVSTFPSGLFSFLSYESVIFQKERKQKQMEGESTFMIARQIFNVLQIKN